MCSPYLLSKLSPTQSHHHRHHRHPLASDPVQNVSSTALYLIDCNEFSFTVHPDRITVPTPEPGLFFGNSTLPASCVGEPPLSCTTSPITDGDYGDTSNGVVSSEFMAWSSNSRLTFTIIGTDTFSQLRRINLAIYHDRTVGAGLPNITLSASISETTPGTAIPYTILDNEDLEAGDAQVRNVTLVLVGVGVGAGMQRIEGNHFHIGFSFTSGIELFAISEVELCTDTGR